MGGHVIPPEMSINAQESEDSIAYKHKKGKKRIIDNMMTSTHGG